jgi:hypothetical protein
MIGMVQRRSVLKEARRPDLPRGKLCGRSSWTGDEF